MQLTAFNALPAPEAGDLVLSCARIPSFATVLTARRPYADVGELLATARAAAAAWTDAEVTAALADHPRIGERPTGAGASAAMSGREQAGVDPADDELRTRLAAGNRRYEERFGRIYLVRAAGRSGAELLDLLEQRLTHDPATELAVTREQLAEIALLRLEGQITP
jgi:2-oxo-4-hydroxy-4-carboxy-5-ureidoimidazoline decarboxylase